MMYIDAKRFSHKLLNPSRPRDSYHVHAYAQNCEYLVNLALLDHLKSDFDGILVTEL